MTEEEWLKATDPTPMLEFLRGKATDRKFRLFAVACCRRVENTITRPQFKHGLEVAEDFADGLVSKDMLVRTASEHQRLLFQLSTWPANDAAQSCTWSHADNGAKKACVEARKGACSMVGTDPALPVHKRRVRPGHQQKVREVERQELKHQVSLVRDVIGNPFQPVSVNRSWLTHTVANLAQTIYGDRQLPSGLFDNQRLAILADALEEAGCDNADILVHLRRGGDHVRGCWAVDLILGRE